MYVPMNVRVLTMATSFEFSRHFLELITEGGDNSRNPCIDLYTLIQCLLQRLGEPMCTLHKKRKYPLKSQNAPGPYIQGNVWPLIS